MAIDASPVRGWGWLLMEITVIPKSKLLEVGRASRELAAGASHVLNVGLNREGNAEGLEEL
eukprot:3263691-Alexandrium_andersonii.AAC.1